MAAPENGFTYGYIPTTQPCFSQRYASRNVVPTSASDARGAALRLVQEVGRGAEGTAHRAVVERDEAHRADFGESRLARRLARQRPHTAGPLEPLPVGGVGHALVGRVEDGVAQLGAG